jgi:phage/plasmid-associated DNA primase
MDENGRYEDGHVTDANMEMLTDLAVELRRQGWPDFPIADALLDVNAKQCNPPFRDHDVYNIAYSVSRYGPGKQFALTDMGNAERLVARYGHNLHFCVDTGEWLYFDRTHWAVNRIDMVIQLAKKAIRSILRAAESEPDPVQRAEMIEWAKRSMSQPRIRTMISLAKHEPDIPVRQNQLDTDPFTLNVLNGTFSLKTGRWSHHIRTDLITTVVPVEIAEIALASDKERLSDIEAPVEVTNQ